MKLTLRALRRVSKTNPGSGKAVNDHFPCTLLAYGVPARPKSGTKRLLPPPSGWRKECTGPRKEAGGYMTIVSVPAVESSKIRRTCGIVLYSIETAELDKVSAISEDGGRRDKMVSPAENCGEVGHMRTEKYEGPTAPLRSSTAFGWSASSTNAP